MGIVQNNSAMASVTGTVGNVYYRMVRGKQIVCARPKRGRKPTPRQAECQRRFGDTSKRVKEFLKDPAVKEKYQAKRNNKKFTAHMVAQSDMMTAPKMNGIDVSSYDGEVGDQIIVQAMDDLKTHKVIVAVVGQSGVVIESGEAIQDKVLHFNWHYTATVRNPDVHGSTVRVSVYDLHGNIGTKERPAAFYLRQDDIG